MGVEWRQVGEGPEGLRLYRVDADSGNVSLGGGGAMRSPIDLVFQRFETPTTRYLREHFTAPGSPVGASSFAVACHVVSLPDLMFVVDSTYRTTADDVFPGALAEIAADEGRALGDRPIQVLYTHAHFDHAGGHEAVEAMGRDVQILAHPDTERLFPFVSRREMFFRLKEVFFRDCGIEASLEELTDQIRQLYLRMIDESGADMSRTPWGSIEDGPLRIDAPIEEDADRVLAGGRIRLLEFGGHIPGHLCVLVDGAHFITGDMWLPATTSLVTPRFAGREAGVGDERFGVLRYVESDLELLGMPVDECMAYPSHEIIYRNPKRMAMRDLELLVPRLERTYRILEEHQATPMRILDVAWGGAAHVPLWKIDGSMFRLVVAHDEAAAFVHDMAAVGDLREVEPERWIWTGKADLHDRLHATLLDQRRSHGDLEFESRGRAA